ncbi:hypothetical protein H9P43_008153 [Blastocladiella emersonii ATCC 22665]|nr:hypothetical protein H9P43_008153 [Blastocladiella emersonii ATCC 22665]
MTDIYSKSFTDESYIRSAAGQAKRHGAPPPPPPPPPPRMGGDTTTTETSAKRQSSWPSRSTDNLTDTPPGRSFSQDSDTGPSPWIAQPRAGADMGGMGGGERVEGALSSYESMVEGAVSGTWGLAKGAAGTVRDTAGWAVQPLADGAAYYAGVAVDTARVYLRAYPMARAFLYVFGLLTAIPTAIFLTYAAITLGICLTVAAAGMLLTEGFLLGASLLLYGPALFFSFLGASLAVLTWYGASTAWSLVTSGVDVVQGGADQGQQQQMQQSGTGGMMGTGGGKWSTSEAGNETRAASFLAGRMPTKEDQARAEEQRRLQAERIEARQPILG